MRFVSASSGPFHSPLALGCLPSYFRRQSMRDKVPLRSHLGSKQLGPSAHETLVLKTQKNAIASGRMAKQDILGDIDPQHSAPMFSNASSAGRHPHSASHPPHPHGTACWHIKQMPLHSKVGFTFNIYIYILISGIYLGVQSRLSNRKRKPRSFNQSNPLSSSREAVEIHFFSSSASFSSSWNFARHDPSHQHFKSHTLPSQIWEGCPSDPCDNNINTNHRRKAPGYQGPPLGNLAAGKDRMSTKQKALLYTFVTPYVCGCVSNDDPPNPLLYRFLGNLVAEL